MRITKYRMGFQNLDFITASVNYVRWRFFLILLAEFYTIQCYRIVILNITYKKYVIWFVDRLKGNDSIQKHGLLYGLFWYKSNDAFNDTFCVQTADHLNSEMIHLKKFWFHSESVKFLLNSSPNEVSKD